MIRTVLCAALVLLAAPLPAHATAGGCYLRLAHLSPDTPAVDVTVTTFGRPDWSIKLNGVAYGDMSGYQRIEAGTYTISMRPAGADPASKPVISASLEGADGQAYTVAGLGKFAALSLKVLNDDISLPPTGQARMRAINAAPTTGAMDITRDGSPVITNAAFADPSPYQTLAAGTTTLKLTPKQAAPTELPVNLDAGAVYTVLVLERNGTLTAVARQDAKGAEVVPSGPIEAGYGGTAPQNTTPWTLILLTTLTAAAALTLRRKTPYRTTP
ncbi:DUF4397 domain-containing protein [Actinocrispum sp. NPDC049592]|uniref:DUF4397 domain-containing protein n=1 Tax=Actinocrispum sp. NPDC049592 TaxID=3154835 RepID=UPI0034386EB8